MAEMNETNQEYLAPTEGSTSYPFDRGQNLNFAIAYPAFDLVVVPKVSPRMGESKKFVGICDDSKP